MRLRVRWSSSRLEAAVVIAVALPGLAGLAAIPAAIALHHPVQVSHAVALPVPSPSPAEAPSPEPPPPPSPTPAPPPPPPQPARLFLTERNNGQHFTVRSGTLIDVQIHAANIGSEPETSDGSDRILRRLTASMSDGYTAALFRAVAPGSAEIRVVGKSGIYCPAPSTPKATPQPCIGIMSSITFQAYIRVA